MAEELLFFGQRESAALAMVLGSGGNVRKTVIFLTKEIVALGMVLAVGGNVRKTIVFLTKKLGPKLTQSRLLSCNSHGQARSHVINST